MKKFLAIAICLVLLCGCTAPQQDNGKLNIVTTNFVCFDFVRAVVGDTANISILIPVGSDIHSFEPSAHDIANINDCDLFVYIGGESDVWVERTLDNLNLENSLKLIDGIPLIKNGETYDEHIWTSPENSKRMINSILEKICEVHAENSQIYRKNAEEYIKKISEAEQETKNVISTAKVKKIVVADRFPLIYFTEYFGIEYVAAFGGCEHDTDADLHTVAKLIDAVNKDGLKTVYCISGSGLSVADAVVNATGATKAELHSFVNITPVEFQNGTTYIDIMKRNTEALRKGLN